MKKTLVVVFGPTAAGKTEAAITVAQHFRTEIISADSRQFYRELNIGVAKPTTAELAKVPHHFVGHISIHDDYSAGDYEQQAITLIERLFLKHKVVVMVGGSGLFIKAVLEGLDRFPETEQRAENELKEIFARDGIERLQNLLKENDPDYYEEVDRNNPQRLMRALAVTLSSGKPYSSFRKTQSKKRNFGAVKIGLNLPREILYSRIDQRADEMMNNGLLEEAKQLFPLRNINALQTVGYSELFEFLEGKISMEESVKLIKQHTRNFAKRQMTWFRKEKDAVWFSPEAVEEIISYLSKIITA